MVPAVPNSVVLDDELCGDRCTETQREGRCRIEFSDRLLPHYFTGDGAGIPRPFIIIPGMLPIIMWCIDRRSSTIAVRRAAIASILSAALAAFIFLTRSSSF